MRKKKMEKKRLQEEKLRRKFKKKLKEISDAGTEKRYIFRGEKKHYSKVASNLYRHYRGMFPVSSYLGENLTVLLEIERSIVREAKRHFSFSDPNIKILTELQHYGGETALIDFTRNINIALFFACDGSFDEDGRIILFDTSGIKVKREISYDDESEYKVIDPIGKDPRVIFQSSTFVHAAKGFIERKKFKSIEIPKELKKEFLVYLRKSFNIKENTIYNDIHGFIQSQKEHTDAEKKSYEGLMSYLKGNYEEAIKHYDEALKSEPFSIAAYINRGIAKGGLEKLGKAIEDYNEAIDLDPTRTSAYINRGIARKKLGKLEGAIKDFDQAIDLNSKEAYPYFYRGIAKNELGEPREAIKDFNQVIKLKPSPQLITRVYIGRGDAKVQLKNPKEAIEDYDRAIELNPEHAEAYLRRADVKYCYLGEIEKAVKDYERVIELKPDHPETLEKLGRAKSDLAKSKRKKKRI